MSDGTIALVLAAGEGVRSGGRKQFREVRGRSVLGHACESVAAMPEIDGVIAVVPADAVAGVRETLGATAMDVVAGGATRHLSSRAGLAALPQACDMVLIHDAALGRTTNGSSNSADSSTIRPFPSGLDLSR